MEMISLEKPARYIGGEVNSYLKDEESTDLSMVLAFPDLYEVGMSHLGSKILYEVANAIPWVACERVYAPWVDLEEALRRNKRPLTSLESGRALSQFDIIGFSLQYELHYTNLLNMLDLGGIPLFSKEREDDDPLVIAGGPGAFNPEAIADFLDLVVLGDGEEILPAILNLYREEKRQSQFSRHRFLRAAAKIDGVYIPELYHMEYGTNGSVTQITASIPGIPLPVKRAIVRNLDEAPPSVSPPLPFVEVIHDRGMLELFRGCSRGCRFCQAGILYRPVRERSVDNLIAQADRLLKNTGYDELSLTSLSSMDYSRISALVDRLVDTQCTQGVRLALSSLRIDSFSLEVASKVQQVRRYGLTLAPEAGSQRMRDRINKNLSEEQILATVSDAFAAGWHSLKLYFMIGLPDEDESDLEGIVSLTRRIIDQYRSLKVKGKLRLSISVAPFVPKAHTPFQWQGQISLEEIGRRQTYLKMRLGNLKGVEFASHDRFASFLEAVFSRGDRRLAPVIHEAWSRGARFDGWGERFNYLIWQESFKACGITAAEYAERCYPEDTAFPWDHLDSGVRKNWLLNEYNRACQLALTPDCRDGICSDCGVCSAYNLIPHLAKEVSDEANT
ncbi:MAG: TIGR03960 family B12-binding radical SAM protein [Symbiobacteriaceae bacterium]|nr:TIGR03960 family B12-binding radical SAM protein [Symbiobacteriaceae bacterium]